MKEIGLKLKLERENNGVSLEEAAEDLNIDKRQLKSIEEGNKEDLNKIEGCYKTVQSFATAFSKNRSIRLLSYQ